MELKIEKGIPMPNKLANAGPSAALKGMEVGDSVLVPGAKSAASIAVLYGRLKPLKFSGRTVNGGVRVWRIE